MKDLFICFITILPVDMIWSAIVSLANILAFIVPAFIGFLVFYFYWDLDRKTEQFDERCREDLESEEAFRTIRRGAAIKFVVTSDTRRSKAKASIQKLKSERSNKPYKIVPVESQSEEERKKEIILERCKDIPGKNIIQPELLGALRNYYAYKLSLSQEGKESDVTQYFYEKFQSYEYAGRILDLRETEHYENICLIENQSERPIRIFLQVLEGVEKHCLNHSEDLDKQEDEIERCREIMMFYFYGLWAGELKGFKLTKESDLSRCISKFREDIKQEDNSGYWILASNDIGKGNFGRFKNVGWKVENELNEYWGEENFTNLYPGKDSIPAMEYVENPFIIFKKNYESFNSGPVSKRIKGKEKYRMKSDYKN
ncbi:hypothetical protein ACLI4Q_15230 [Natrialbaceae archaeon A-CW1-1]